MVDDDKLEVFMARQEAADERKRNLSQLEDQEQQEFDSLDLRRHREQFRGLQRKKGERGSVSGIFTRSLEGCVECAQN